MIKGHGVSFIAAKEHWHGRAIPKDQLAAAIKEIGPAIELPHDPGWSCARTSLPKSPNFPAPAPPDYDPSKPVATREAYGFALKRLGAVNPHIAAISGDVKNSTFSEIFGDTFPDHFYQGYIAEQNLVSAGVGLAARGKVPSAFRQDILWRRCAQFHSKPRGAPSSMRPAMPPNPGRIPAAWWHGPRRRGKASTFATWSPTSPTLPRRGSMTISTAPAGRQRTYSPPSGCGR
jgi:Transketolase, pyrimidine binding domain